MMQRSKEMELLNMEAIKKAYPTDIMEAINTLIVCLKEKKVDLIDCQDTDYCIDCLKYKTELIDEIYVMYRNRTTNRYIINSRLSMNL